MKIMTKSKRGEAAGKAVLAAGQNSLKIMYPAATDVLPVEVPVTAWMRYIGPDGSGLRNQRIHVETSEFASVYPGDVKTDQDGWATTQITFKKPETLGTVASYKATLTAIATDTPSDSDQATLTASTSAGGPGILVLDDTVDSGEPRGDCIVGGIWTLISGRYTRADGTPAANRYIWWDVSGDSGSGELNPELPTSVTYTNNDGLFCNFVLTSSVPTVENLKIELGAQNVMVVGSWDLLTKSYPAGCIPTPTPGHLQLGNPGYLYQGVPGWLQMVFDGPVGYSSTGRRVTWHAAPSPATFAHSTTTTDENSLSNNQVTPASTPGTTYSEALWAEIIDNGVRGRGAVVVTVYDTSGQTSDQAETLSVTSPDGTTFVPGKSHTMEAILTDYQGNPVAGRPVLWSGYPEGRFSLSQPYPSTTDASGKARIEVTALSSDPLDRASIYARVANVLSGQLQDAGFYGSIAGAPAASITVTSTDPLPLELYKPHELVATYTADDNNNKSITWSAEPEGSVSLNPNSSTTSSDGQGRATTTITGYGPNVPINSVTVYASTYNNQLGNPVVGTIQLSFKPGAAPDPDAALIDLVSVDGNPLTAGDTHLIQATYTKLDGTPIAGQPIQWQPFPAKKITVLDSPTYTNDDGVATTGVTGDLASAPFDGKIQASTNNPGTQAIDQASLTLTFQQDVTLPGSIPMQLTSADAAPLTEEAWHAFKVSYAENADIYWTAFPSDRVSFEQPNPTTTNENGISINRVNASGGDDISDAIISARSFNALTGDYDHADVAISFTKPAPVSKLFGVTLEKAYAQNAFSLSLGDATEYIECQVQALTGQGQQKLILTTNPDQAYVLMYDASGKRLPTDQETGKPYVTTDANGLATFMLASLNYTVFDLIATLDKNDAVSASLTIATNDKKNNPALPAPQSAAVVNGTLTIPAARPAQTFKVGIPSSTNVNPGSQLALLLNDRLVYRGPASVGLNGEIEVAYAALNLDKGSNNSLVYVVATRESSPLSFTASGKSQTGPDTGGAPRVLSAPVVNVAGNAVGPTDIVEPGLSVDIPPYSGVLPNDDVITLYFYLSGQDVLTSAQVNNIVPVTYKVDSNSPLLGGEPATLVVPQAYLAGYANGQLRVDYKVVSFIGTRWSDVSSTYVLNTTL
jgi:hypothetical protein